MTPCRYWLALPLVVVCGCRAYRPQPLDLLGYADTWRAAPLEVEPVREYARKLGESAGAESSPFDLADGITLAEAEAIALHFNPDLRIARAEAGVPLANAQEAGWWPDPRVETELLRFTDRGSRTGYQLDGPSFDGVSTQGIETTPAGYRRVEGDYVDDPWIVDVGFSLTIPLSGRLAVEQDLWWSRYDAAWRDIVVQEWRLLTQLRTTWLEWSAARAELEATRGYLADLEVLANVSSELVDAGQIKPVDGRVILIELASDRASLIQLEQEARELELDLYALMGVSPDAPLQLQIALFAPDELPCDGNCRDLLLASHPRLLAAEADYLVAEQRLRLEIRQQYPDLNIGPSYSFEEGFSRAGIGFGFDLPLWNHNRQAVADAFAERDAARARAYAAVQNATAEFARAIHRWKEAQRRRDALVSEVVPLADLQLENATALLRLGEVDILLLQEALRRVLSTKIAVLDAQRAVAVAHNDLQQMLQPRWVTSRAERQK